MQFEAISYNLPANPSRYRVATWKKLRELGAVYLQDGVAMVPAQAGMHSSLEELRQNIVSWNGRASLLILEFQQEEDEREVLASFAAARQEEYAGIQADAIRLLNQMEEERSRGKGAPDIDRYLLELRRLRGSVGGGAGTGEAGGGFAGGRYPRPPEPEAPSGRRPEDGAGTHRLGNGGEAAGNGTGRRG